MIDDELVSPEAFALAVRARASYLARETAWQSKFLRPYSQLTLLLGIELEEAAEQVRNRGLQGAYRWALSFGQPEGLPKLDITP